MARHINAETYAGAWAEWVAFSRIFAVLRSRDWPAWRRAAYALGSIILPILRGARYLGLARQTGKVRTLARGFDVFVVALLASALGEMRGYATGDADLTATQQIELHRRRYAPSAPPAR